MNHQVTSYPLRLAPDVRTRLEVAAKNSGRSLNAEIQARLASADQQKLRDLFAIEALRQAPMWWNGDLPGLAPFDVVAARAYEFADAMLQARGA